MTPSQVDVIAHALRDGAPSCVSVFAGRIADAGIEPLPIMSQSLEILESVAPAAELIWASPREVLNLVQADSIGCHIITMTHDLIAKLDLLGKDLDAFSLETVQMFRSARPVRRLPALSARAEGTHHRRGWLHRQHAGGPAERRGHRGRHLRQPVAGAARVHRRGVRPAGRRVRAGRRARRGACSGARSRDATRSSTSRRTRTCVTGSTSRRAISSRTRSRPPSCSRRCAPQASTASPSRPPARSTESPRSSPRPRRARSRCRRRSTAPRSSQERV